VLVKVMNVIQHSQRISGSSQARAGSPRRLPAPCQGDPTLSSRREQNACPTTLKLLLLCSHKTARIGASHGPLAHLPSLSQPSQLKGSAAAELAAKLCRTHVVTPATYAT
jgi:hypothetical protein